MAVALCCGLSSYSSGCRLTSSATPVVGGTPDRDASVYQECSSLCIRPGDCAQAFNDDGICPPGFLCALRFSCGAPGD